MTGSLRQRGVDSCELRVYLGVDSERGRERWATKTVHGTRRHATACLAEFVEEAGYARLRGRHHRRSSRPPTRCSRTRRWPRFVYSLPVRHDAVLPGGPAVPAVFTQVRDVLDEAVKNGEVRDDVSLDRAVDMLGRAFEAAMGDWADGHVSDPRTRLEELLRILFGGLAAERLSP